ncbi:MAG: MBL fold metallo-hydrolase [Bacteroidaceae bacterium]|nr:MBL fold metallo-hydrolase [Bacteroidaceae bacterium]
MHITILGTGTSTGVPQIGCTCPTCTSADPRDKRLRCSAIVEAEGKRILIDCGPDFRQQMLRTQFKPFDAVLITHEHYDHVGGLDDLRPYSIFGDVHIYADALSAKHLTERLPYCFIPKERRYPGVPALDLRVATPHVPIRVGGLEIIPLLVMHGKLPILGYRIGNMAYITDMKTLPDEELPLLRGIDTLVLNALRHEPHPTHQTIEEAVAFARSLGSPETYLIHMSHHIQPHAQEEALLPAGFHLAYDGLEFEC